MANQDVLLVEGPADTGNDNVPDDKESTQSVADNETRLQTYMRLLFHGSSLDRQLERQHITGLNPVQISDAGLTCGRHRLLRMCRGGAVRLRTLPKHSRLTIGKVHHFRRIHRYIRVYWSCAKLFMRWLRHHLSHEMSCRNGFRATIVWCPDGISGRLCRQGPRLRYRRNILVSSRNVLLGLLSLSPFQASKLPQHGNTDLVCLSDRQ